MAEEANPLPAAAPVSATFFALTGRRRRANHPDGVTKDFFVAGPG